jgi:hypothetical protein
MTPDYDRRDPAGQLANEIMRYATTHELSQPDVLQACSEIAGFMLGNCFPEHQSEAHRIFLSTLDSAMVASSELFYASRH